MIDDMLMLCLHLLFGVRSLLSNLTAGTECNLPRWVCLVLAINRLLHKYSTPYLLNSCSSTPNVLQAALLLVGVGRCCISTLDVLVGTTSAVPTSLWVSFPSSIML